MKTLSSPLVDACCYNICLLVDSGVIRVAQRLTLLSWNKSEQESRRKWAHARVQRQRDERRKKERERSTRDEQSVTIIMHRCPGTPMSKYIYCPPPSCAFCPLTFFFSLVAVCQPPLLPFHTVITHLYIGRGSRPPLRINRASPLFTWLERFLYSCLKEWTAIRNS